MSNLEIGLYNHLLTILLSKNSLISDYLDGKLNRSIESWKRHGLDEPFSVLFGSHSISDKEKLAIMNMLSFFTESAILSTLRLFEGDLYECEGYTPPITPDEYDKTHPDYRGGLIRVVDLEGKSITDNSMYENFIGYLSDQSKN